MADANKRAGSTSRRLLANTLEWGGPEGPVVRRSRRDTGLQVMTGHVMAVPAEELILLAGAVGPAVVAARQLLRARVRRVTLRGPMRPDTPSNREAPRP